MGTKEPTRLGDWQLDQEIDEFLITLQKHWLISEDISHGDEMMILSGIKQIVKHTIQRHERTLRRHGLLVETKQTELEKKEEETHA